MMISLLAETLRAVERFHAAHELTSIVATDPEMAGMGPGDRKSGFLEKNFTLASVRQHSRPAAGEGVSIERSR